MSHGPLVGGLQACMVSSTLRTDVLELAVRGCTFPTVPGKIGPTPASLVLSWPDPRIFAAAKCTGFPELHHRHYCIWVEGALPLVCGQTTCTLGKLAFPPLRKEGGRLKSLVQLGEIS